MERRTERVVFFEEAAGGTGSFVQTDGSGLKSTFQELSGGTNDSGSDWGSTRKWGLIRGQGADPPTPSFRVERESVWGGGRGFLARKGLSIYPLNHTRKPTKIVVLLGSGLVV